MLKKGREHLYVPFVYHARDTTSDEITQNLLIQLIIHCLKSVFYPTARGKER